MKPITQKEIANKLNLSISTVSRALKNHPDIGHETKRRVKELAATVDYVPHSIASHLRSGNSKIIALVLPTLSVYFYYSVINAVEEWIAKEGYSLVVYQTNGSTEMENEIINKCRRLPVAGMMMAISNASREMNSFKSLIDNNIPVVFYDRVPFDKSYNRIYFDGDGAAELAMSKLLAKSPNSINIFLGNKSISITEPRKRGCENALASFENINPKVTYHYLNNEIEAEREADLIFKSKEFDAFFCMSDELITGIMKSAQKSELKQYTDFDIIGISNGIIPHYYYPAISFIETNGFDLGKEAIRRLYQLMNNDPFTMDIRVPYKYVKE